MSCFIVLGCCLLEACSFLKGNRGGRSGGRERWGQLGGVEGGKTVSRVYYMRKKAIFNKRENNSNSHIMMKDL